MISPASGATYRPELAGAVREYNTQYAILSQFIGQLVLPEFKTPIAEAGFPLLAKENFRKLVDTGRAPGGGFSRSTWSWDKGTFDCLENAHEIPLDNKEAAKYVDVIDYEEESSIGADFIVRLASEKRVADAVMNATTFTATNVAVDWDTVATSTPLADLDVEANKLEDQLGIGREQFSLILPRTKWQALRNSVAVLAALKEWDSGISRREQIKLGVVKEYLDLKQILIGRAAYDSADEGQSQVFSQIWPSRYGMLALLAPGAQAPRKTLSLGRQVRWTDGMPDYVTIETYDDPSIDGRVVRARQFTDEMIQATFAAGLMDLDKAT